MKRSYKLILLALVVCGALVLAFIDNPYSEAIDKDASITLCSGSDFGTLKDSLRASGALKSMSTFELVARLRKLDRSVKAGHYTLSKGDSYMTIVRRLRGGEQTPITVTFNNIRSLEQFAGVISKSIEADSIELLTLLRNDSLQQSYGMNNQTMLGMFIPNSYEFYWTISASKFIDRMHDMYNSFWNEKRLGQLHKSGLSQIEAMTLASIVYEESKIEDEMPTIAGVYLNRLRIGMPLQADPTVKFAIGDPSLKRILFKHLEYDSPYNTYKHRGLPPGPIAMPSITAIESVLSPQTHKYLYFCAKADFSGRHAFARTLSEHNRNAAAYSAQLNKRRIK